MSNSRDQAHIALRNLWEAADARLRQPDAVERMMGETLVREVETEAGAKICSYAGHLTVKAEFEKAGTDETIEVAFAEDIRDLAVSEVRIDWRNESGFGTNTPPMREFPKLVEDLIVLV